MIHLWWAIVVLWIIAIINTFRGMKREDANMVNISCACASILALVMMIVTRKL